MMEAIEDRIRKRAYEIWEQEGQPHGREVDHWLRAAEEIAAAEGRGNGRKLETAANAPGPVEAQTRKAGGKEPKVRKEPTAKTTTPAGAASAARVIDRGDKAAAGRTGPGESSAPAPRRATRAKGGTPAAASPTRRRGTT